MQRQHSKTHLILCALFALFVLTLPNAQPMTAAKGGFNRNKIDPALLEAIKTNPKGRLPVIVQTMSPDAKSASSYHNINSKTELARINLNRAQGAAAVPARGDEPPLVFHDGSADQAVQVVDGGEIGRAGGEDKLNVALRRARRAARPVRGVRP